MKTILVPTDFSNNANNALRYAGAFAQAMQSELKILHVSINVIGRYNRVSDLFLEEIADLKKKSKKQLEKLCDKYAKTPCSILVETGNPVNKIIETSKKSRADIIIMGTHGASGLNRILFGSNASETISKSEIPVLAIPQRYRFKKIDTIVYASDLKNPVNELKLLIPIAKNLDATIEILNINYGWEQDNIKRKELERKIKLLNYKKIKLIEQKASVENTLPEHINKYLKKRKPEILAMFPEKKSWFDKVFNLSNTEGFSYNLKIPLLSIRKSVVKKK